MRNIFKLFSKKPAPDAKKTVPEPSITIPAAPPPAPAPAPAFIDPDTERLEKLFARISVVKDGAELVETLRRNGVSIRFTEDLPAGADTMGACRVYTRTIRRDGTFTIETPEILLSPKGTDDQAAVALLHEGRHAVQALQGIHPLCRILSKQDKVAYTQFTEADAGSFSLAVTLKIFVATMDSALIVAAIRTPEDDQAMSTMLNLLSQARDQVDDPLVHRFFFEAWFNSKEMKAAYDDFSAKGWEATQKDIAGDWNFVTSPVLPLTVEEVLPLGAISGSANYLLIPDMPAVTMPYRADAAATPAPAAPASPAAKPPAPGLFR